MYFNYVYILSYYNKTYEPISVCSGKISYIIYVWMLLGERMTSLLDLPLCVNIYIGNVMVLLLKITLYDILE